MRILFLNLSAESLLEANNALAGQGYEITAEIGLNVDQVLAAAPEVLITEATPSDLGCCGLITQLKSRPDTRTLKVVMVVPGGPMERARALDLGADDVVSWPFDAVEFAARVRTQFRERQPQEDLKKMLQYATQRESIADLAVETLNEVAVTKRRRWLLPAIFFVSTAAVVASVLMLVSNRGSRKDTLQLKAEIARLNSGLGQQSGLLERAQQARASFDAQTLSDSATRNSLVAQSEDLRKKMAAGAGADSGSLKQQLTDTQSRLKLLENEGKVAETVVHSYGPSVCLLHVVVEFLDKQSGRPIQIVVDDLGKPRVDDQGMVQLDSGGSGPHLQIDVFGTGFLVRRDGRIVTNHHVAEPWWNNDELKGLLDRGAAAYVLSYKAYFPGNAEGIEAKLDRISSDADVATLKLQAPVPARATLLELDERHDASVTGDPVVLIGYPTGIEGILARAGSDVAQKITDTQNVSHIVSQLALQQLIRPTTTQGHIGDILQDKIVYDAATTSGGSGGPLFNRSGKVIGVNFAILKGFGGSNLAVPVRYANELLK
jgi:S1-C subfamily serine protease/DNA-binding response OmpR family regulator